MKGFHNHPSKQGIYFTGPFWSVIGKTSSRFNCVDREFILNIVISKTERGLEFDHVSLKYKRVCFFP